MLPLTALFGLVLRSDAIGGETDRSHLIKELREQGIEIGGALNLAKARARIEEMSRFALSEIKTTVSGQQLVRADRRRCLEELLIEAESESGIVEITGPGGAGKSGLLKAVSEGRQMSARIVVLAPDRTPPGGWPALSSAFGIDTTAEAFLEDLSCDGGGLICVDGLDRFRDDGQRKTVIDVVSTAFGIKGVTVLFTARPGWEEEAAISFGEELMASLSARRRLLVDGLDDNEANALAEAAPKLEPLLRPDHPAKSLARNPFILRRLVSTCLNTDRVLSEVELAWDWWRSGAHAAGMSDGDIHARRRVLLGVAQGLLSGEALVDVSAQDPAAVATLIADDVLLQISTDRVKFQHDLFTDWAVACTLSEDQQRIKSLTLNETPPFWLSRGFELACRRLAEANENEAWPSITKHLVVNGAKSAWTGLALLALVRSEHASGLLERYADTLLLDGGEFAAMLIRRVIASHGNSAEKVLKDVLPSGITIPKDLTLPAGPQWLQLIGWCLSRFDRLPPEALSAAVSLFEGWLTLATFGERTISPLLLDRLADVLVADIEEDDRLLPRPGDPLPKIKYAVDRDALEAARLQLALHAQSSPSAAERYLSAIAGSKHSGSHMRQLLEFPGHLPSAAPGAFSAAFQGVIQEETAEERSEYRWGRRRPISMSQLEDPFALGRCGIALFTELLGADRKVGIDLIRTLVRSSEGAADSDDGFLLKLAGCERPVSPVFSYGWSRGHAPSRMVFKALEALEFWAHQRVEGGESLDDLVHQMIDDGPISGAILLVIVDLVLSHSELNGELLADLIASPEILALDTSRAQYDIVDRMTGGRVARSSHGAHPADADTEEHLSSRVSRTLALHDAIGQIVFSQPEEAMIDLRERLAEGVARLGAWTDASVDWTSAAFMAAHALRLASKENYELVTEPDGEGRKRRGWSFRWPEVQLRWLQGRSSEATAESESFSRSLAVRMAMNDESGSVNVPVADAEAVLGETANASPRDGDDRHDPKDPWRNRVAAAAFIARFGSDRVIRERLEVLSTTFDKALKQVVREPHNLNYDVMYDAQALAIAGLLYLASRFQRTDDCRALLGAVSTFPASGVSAFSRHREAAESLGDKPLRAAVRIGLQACVFPWRKRFDEDEAAFGARQSRLRETQATRLAAELEWIQQGGDEPAWSSPPPRRQRRPKRTITLPGGRTGAPRARSRAAWPDFYFDNRTAAVWLRALSQFSKIDPSSVAALLKANRDWLVDTNGSGKDGEDEKDLERTWTRGLLECAAAKAEAWSDEAQELIFDILDEFSDEAFIDASAAFLVQSDLKHIEGSGEETTYLVEIRQRLWTRLKETPRWRQHLWSPRGGMEIHLKELIAAFYFKLSYGFGGGTAYTKGLREDQLTPFLPLLTEITVASAPCPTIALLFLDVLERIEPKNAEPFLVLAAASWITDGDRRFWNELGVGLRVCAIAENAKVDSSAPRWAEIADAIAAAGVPAGETLKRAMRESSS